jgi:hypothetical protein
MSRNKRRASLGRLLIVASCVCAVAGGCLGAGAKVTRLQEENAELAERIRQDQVRLLNLEERNRQLQTRLAEAERDVALLHDSVQGGGVIRR